MRTESENIKKEVKRTEMLSSQKLQKLSAVKKLSQIPDSPVKNAHTTLLRPAFLHHWLIVDMGFWGTETMKQMFLHFQMKARMSVWK